MPSGIADERDSADRTVTPTGKKTKMNGFVEISTLLIHSAPKQKSNEWMHLSPFYTRMHGELLRYAKSTSQFHWRFLLVRDVRGFQVNPLCRHDITHSDRQIGKHCSLSVELGSRLERPIHFECKLNEPMRIGMRLLHPAAADHSVSISRQQVQRIFSFSLRSRAVLIVLLQTYLLKVAQDSGVGGRRFSGGGLLCRVDCTHQAALPPVVLQRPSPLCASAR